MASFDRTGLRADHRGFGSIHVGTNRSHPADATLSTANGACSQVLQRCGMSGRHLTVRVEVVSGRARLLSEGQRSVSSAQ